MGISYVWLSGISSKPCIPIGVYYRDYDVSFKFPEILIYFSVKKILIVSDSHSSVAYGTIYKDILKQTEPLQKPVKLGSEFILFENCLVNDYSIDILGLMGRSAYNFEKHIDIVKDKDYKDYKVVLFMGYNDLLFIEKYNNHKVVVDRYIDSAINRFGDKIVILTPLKSMYLIKTKPQHTPLYNQFIQYMKEYCAIKSIECHDIYSILGSVTKDDLWDKHHVRTDKLLPLYEFLGVIPSSPSR